MKKFSLYIVISVSLLFFVPLSVLFYHSNKYHNNISEILSCVTSKGSISYCLKNPKKELFVVKCVLNKKVRSDCSCKYDALNDEMLPDGFDNIIKTWAHKSDKELYIAYAKTFGQSVLYEAIGVRADVSKNFLNIRKIAYGKAVRKLLNNISDGLLKSALKNIRSKAIGYRMATATTNMNIVYASMVAGGVASNYSRYKVVIDHHCGGSFSDLYEYYKKYDETKETISQTASKYTDMYKKMISEYANGSIKSLLKSTDEIGNLVGGMIPHFSSIQDSSKK